MENEKVRIGTRLYTPDRSNEKAELTHYYCKLTKDCPLLKKNTCILNRVSIGLMRCPYGWKKRLLSGSTKRGKAYREFVSEAKSKFASGEYKSPPKGYYGYCIQEIGEYIYLPYSHIDHCDIEKEGVPFLAYSGFMKTGYPFMRKEEFTVENICKIIGFRPHALMGGEIEDYQKKELPRFLYHLKYLFPELYKEVKEKIPKVEKKCFSLNSNLEVEATLSDIPAGMTEGYKIMGGARVEEWDGETITIIGDKDDLSILFGKYKAESEIKMTFKPVKNETKVVIESEELKHMVCLNNPELIPRK